MNLKVLLNILFPVHIISCTYCQKLLVVVSEGFAGSYYYPYSHLPAFQFFEQKGVWTDFLYPVFPSLSIPNQYSIVTGRYPVSHGITGDYMYNSETDAYFMAGTSPSDFSLSWWEGAEPIWVTATKSRVPVALFYWPECQVEFSARPDQCVPMFRGTNQPALNPTNVKAVIEATKQYDLVLAYHKAIQTASELLGPKAIRRGNNSAVREFAEVLQLITEEAAGRIDLNVIVLSDHGVADVPRNNQRFLEEYIDMNLIRMTIGYGAIKQIIPQRGKANEVFDVLRKQRPIPDVKIYYTVRRMSDLPRWYEYRKSPTIPELILVAKPGYAIYTRDPDKQVPVPSASDWRPGLSGYNNHFPEMLGIFLAYGPSMYTPHRRME